MSNIAIGAHIGSDDPITDAKALNIPHIQLFCGQPQTFKAAVFPHPGGAQGLKAQAEAENIGIYVHARYVINVASPNNKVRIPSRKLLQTDVDEDDPTLGFENWVKALSGLDMKVPVLIENTAGGNHAMARHFDTIARLWDFVGDTGVGFCLDTCHAHAGGISMTDVAEKIISITGGIDLVHCNDSRDEFASGRDRHANLGEGNIAMEDILHCLTTANAPVILETPSEGVVADIALLNSSLN